MRRLSWFVFYVCVICLFPVCAHADPLLRRASLEFSLEEYQIRFVSDAPAHGAGTAVGIGLGWQPVSWFAVHGALNASWLWLVDASLVSRHLNGVTEDSHFGSLGLEAALDFQLSSGIAGVTATAGGRSYFSRYRAGIFVLYAGCGVFAQPIYGDPSGIRAIRFGADVRFWLLDHFAKIFDAQAARPELVIYIRLAI